MVRVVSAAADVEAVARAAEGAARIAVDVESNGMFVYRAKTCVVQLAFEGEVIVVEGYTDVIALLQAYGLAT